MTVIREFKGQYRFLSNFYMVPVEFEGEIYPSSEHAYMAAKTEVFAIRKQIAACATPAEAKKMGRRIKLRDGWETMKYKLLLTCDAELVEGNWWGDKIWGVCLKTGEGQNLLGKALMQVRKEIQSHLLPTITVINKHHGDQGGEYIGRGSPLGNPYPIEGANTRDVVIEKYRVWLNQKIEACDPVVCDELNRLVDIAHTTGTLKLKCFCAPAACHGDVIKETILTAWNRV